VIDRNRCEGKGPCVLACPTAVLAMGVLSVQQRRSLGLVGRIRAWAHHHRQVVVVAPERCEACAACVEVCPEQAISLRRNLNVLPGNQTS
jgi:NAD-dependent dihydropyrimidine dehydrogenase PreA subunit